MCDNQEVTSEKSDIKRFQREKVPRTPVHDAEAASAAVVKVVSVEG